MFHMLLSSLPRTPPMIRLEYLSRQASSHACKPSPEFKLDFKVMPLSALSLLALTVLPAKAKTNVIAFENHILRSHEHNCVFACICADLPTGNPGATPFRYSYIKT